jgi:hypothetical protein
MPTVQAATTPTLAPRERWIERQSCTLDAPKPNCLWEANKTGGQSRRSPGRLRLA